VDYFDRLILRALAVPRDRGGAELFDPFEQTAPLEGGLPPAAVRPAVADAHAIPTTTAQAHTLAAEPVPQAPAAVTLPAEATSLKALQPATAMPVPVAAPALVPLVSSATQVTHNVRLTPPAPESPVVAAPEAGSLAQADAFFRTLGVPSVPVAETPPRGPATHEPEAPPRPRKRTAAPDTPVLMPSRRAMAPERAPVSSPAVASAAAAAGLAPAAAPSRAARRTAPAESVVQTTVVVQRSATRWADELGTLARGSPMGRFGRGQW
jgi:hypothetical protein